MSELLQMYLLFFRMGAVTFGGGYAMLPILRREIIQSRQWMDEETIMDYYALSQGLPGIIAVNVAVFIGYYRKKIPGALAAALGVVSPCVLIITIIYYLLSGGPCWAAFPLNRHVGCLSLCWLSLPLLAVSPSCTFQGVACLLCPGHGRLPFSSFFGPFPRILKFPPLSPCPAIGLQ